MCLPASIWPKKLKSLENKNFTEDSTSIKDCLDLGLNFIFDKKAINFTPHLMKSM